jgi:hypothetical protein
VDPDRARYPGRCAGCGCRDRRPGAGILGGHGCKREYLAIVSNILFVVGGSILIIGVFISLFKMRKTGNICKLILSPLLLFERRGLIPARREEMDEEQDAVWLLIFPGATLIVFSILASLNHLIYLSTFSQAQKV